MLSVPNRFTIIYKKLALIEVEIKPIASIDPIFFFLLTNIQSSAKLITVRDLCLLIKFAHLTPAPLRLQLACETPVLINSLQRVYKCTFTNFSQWSTVPSLYLLGPCSQTLPHWCYLHICLISFIYEKLLHYGFVFTIVLLGLNLMFVLCLYVQNLTWAITSCAWWHSQTHVWRKQELILKHRKFMLWETKRVRAIKMHQKKCCTCLASHWLNGYSHLDRPVSS